MIHNTVNSSLIWTPQLWPPLSILIKLRPLWKVPILINVAISLKYEATLTIKTDPKEGGVIRESSVDYYYTDLAILVETSLADAASSLLFGSRKMAQWKLPSPTWPIMGATKIIIKILCTMHNTVVHEIYFIISLEVNFVLLKFCIYYWNIWRWKFHELLYLYTVEPPNNRQDGTYIPLCPLFGGFFIKLISHLSPPPPHQKKINPRWNPDGSYHDAYNKKWRFVDRRIWA